MLAEDATCSHWVLAVLPSYILGGQWLDCKLFTLCRATRVPAMTTRPLPKSPPAVWNLATTTRVTLVLVADTRVGVVVCQVDCQTAVGWASSVIKVMAVVARWNALPLSPHPPQRRMASPLRSIKWCHWGMCRVLRLLNMAALMIMPSLIR
jgi:hypothetical protein